MVEERYKCTYERIIPDDRIPYWLFWSLFGVVAFLISEVVARASSEHEYRLAWAMLAVLLALIPFGFTWISHGFQRTTRRMRDLFWEDDKQFDEWMAPRFEATFTFTRRAKIFTTILLAAAFLTILLPASNVYRSRSLNLLIYIEMSVCFIVGLQTAYMLVSLLGLLMKIVRMPVTVPFYRLPHPEISSLQNYFSGATLIVTVAYIVLVIAAWASPLSSLVEARVWLVILALYPFTMFIWTLTQVRYLNQRVRDNQIDIVNREVQLTLSKVSGGSDVSSVERLEKIMDVQLRVKSMKVWPIEWQSAVTFVATLLLVIAQIAVIINQVSTP